MVPVVDNASAIHAYSLGLGKLRELISCVVHEELNGDYSIEFEYPITGWAYNALLEDSVIRIFPPEKISYNGDFLNPASFDIVKHTKPISGLVKFFGQHVSRRLSGVVTYANTVTGYSRSGDTYSGELDNMFSRCKPSYSTQGYTYPDINGLRTAQNYPTDKTAVVGSVSLTRPKSALSALVGDEESLVSVLGGDVFFADNGYDLYVYYDAHRGKDRGASIRFGVNMLDVEQEKDMTGAYNAVVPFWDDGNGNITYVSGYIVQPTTPITPVIAVPLDLSNDFETQPTEAQMVELARQHLDTKTPWTGSETIKVDFINGAEIDPHAPDIQLGDTVHVYWGDADIATDLRVVAYDYDVLAERYISLELGTPQKQYVAVTGDYAGASGGGSGGGIKTPVSIENGGTGATTVLAALANLGTLGIISTEYLVSGNDLNNIRTRGIYRTGGTVPAHCPSAATWSILICYVVGTTYIQMLFNGSTIWTRNGNSTDWYTWYRFSGTAT